jgi:putative flippase GtrA
MKLVNNFYFRFRNNFAYYTPRLYNFCDTKKSAVKFFFAGCFAGMTHLVFLAIFHGWFSWPIVLSTSIAFIGSFLVSFSLQKLWTFRDFSQKRTISQFGMYILNAFIALNINGFLMHLLVDKYGVWYLFSQIIVNVSIGVGNFFIYRFIVFRKKHEVNCQKKEIGSVARDVA